MKTGNSIQSKIVTREQLRRKVAQWKILGKTIAFTNGCFDLLHSGHIASLLEASTHADFLIVAINADDSVRKLKGENRPVNSEQDRAKVLAALAMVDAVVIFEEDTPLELIKLVQPDFLIKGGDYKMEEIAGAKEVIEAGGQVILNQMIEGYSTTGLINRLKQSNT